MQKLVPNAKTTRTGRSRGRKHFGRAVLLVFLVGLLILYVSSTFVGLVIVHRGNEVVYFDNKDPGGNALLERLSSVDYYACCGLGHRLIRLSLAHYVAKVKGFALRSFWGWCGEQQPIEVFSYLFRPYTANEVQSVSSQDLILPFYNEVPGFHALVRQPTNGNQTACLCHKDKIEADLELYTSLRNRFRKKDFVDKFVKEHFESATVIGIHVRAGNGEAGDFERKGRSLSNPDAWVKEVCNLIKEFLDSHQSTVKRRPALYIATDTPSMVKLFRNHMERFQIPVLDLPQDARPAEGEGVLFGESDKVHNKGGLDSAIDDDYSSCLRGWTDTIADMFLLSHADVVIAGNPSSFSQTLPMSLAFGKQTRDLSVSYCEIVETSDETINGSTKISGDASPTLQCYDTYMDWCCNYSTWIKFHQKGPKGRPKIHAKEFVRFLLPQNQVTFARKEFSSMRNRTNDCPRPRRGRAGGGLKDKCLPHQW